MSDPSEVTNHPTGNTGENSARERSLANLRPWQPGQSGNPSGRPKKKPITDILERIFEDAEFVEQHLRGVISGKSAVAKVMLIEKAAERLEGKVTQPVEMSGEVNLTIAERMRKAEEKLTNE